MKSAQYLNAVSLKLSTFGMHQALIAWQYNFLYARVCELGKGEPGVVTVVIVALVAIQGGFQSRKDAL